MARLRSPMPATCGATAPARPASARRTSSLSSGGCRRGAAASMAHRGTERRLTAAHGASRRASRRDESRHAHHGASRRASRRVNSAIRDPTGSRARPRACARTRADDGRTHSPLAYALALKLVPRGHTPAQQTRDSAVADGLLRACIGWLRPAGGRVPAADCRRRASWRRPKLAVAEAEQGQAGTRKVAGQE